MKRCVIFCAAGFDSLAVPIDKDDLVIAADGGLQHTQRLGITPDVMVPVDEEVFAAIYANALEPEKDPQIQAAVEALKNAK